MKILILFLNIYIYSLEILVQNYENRVNRFFVKEKI